MCGYSITFAISDKDSSCYTIGIGIYFFSDLAVRKAKYFLNPDRYPTDFTKTQTAFLKTIRNIIRDSEEATLGYGANY